MAEVEHRRRAIQVGAALVAVAFIVGVVAFVGQSGSDGGGRIQGGEEVAALFAGIPQDGKLLGSPRAVVVMAEYADLQCPFCAQYAGDVLPDLVGRYVRPGRVQMELNVVRFLGPDSDPGARATVAAGLQDKMWQFAEIFYRNQGVENSGYVDEEFIQDVAAAVPGLDAERLVRDSATARVGRVVAANESRARRLGVTGTPNFFLARRGRTASRLPVRSLELDTFVTPLQRLTGQR